MECLVRKGIMAGQVSRAYQVYRASKASVDCTAYQAPKALQDPQAKTSMEIQVSQVLLGTGVSQESPTSFQALPESQDKKGTEELQGNEAQLGVQDFRGFQASHPLPTFLGRLGTKGRQGYLA